jgi:hypothetical protein
MNGKGDRPRPVPKDYGERFERIFGKRCPKCKKKECVCVAQVKNNNRDS